jgi:DNA-binding CsgD family transcriptional regulator
LNWRAGPGLVRALLAFQIFCAAIFVWDVSADLFGAGWSLLSDLHLLPEVLAVVGLGLAIIFVGVVLRQMLARQKQLEQGLSVASGALSKLMDNYFATWGLTPTEAAVATFTIKGYSIAEIAALRQSAEGTVKTHLNAIYRKAEVSGRAQLVSLLIEDLMREPLVAAPVPAGTGLRRVV